MDYTLFTHFLTEEARNKFLNFCEDGQTCGFRLNLVTSNEFLINLSSLALSAIGTKIQPCFQNGDYFILSDGEFFVSNLKKINHV